MSGGAAAQRREQRARVSTPSTRPLPDELQQRPPDRLGDRLPGQQINRAHRLPPAERRDRLASAALAPSAADARRAAAGSRRAPRAVARRAASACITSLDAEPPNARSSRSRTSWRWVCSSVIRGVIDVRPVRVVAPDQPLFRHDLQQLERGRIGRGPLARQHLVHLPDRARARAAHSTRRIASSPSVGRGRVGFGMRRRLSTNELRNVNEDLRTKTDDGRRRRSRHRSLDGSARGLLAIIAAHISSGQRSLWNLASTRTSIPPRVVHHPAVREGGAEDRRQLRRPGRGHEGVEGPGDRREEEGAVLRRRRLPPRHQRLHDPGRRPARPGHRRPGLPVRRRVPSVAAARSRRHPVDGQLPARTPTAASSSSRSGRRRTSIAATRCSAPSSKGSTSCAGSARCRPAGRIARSRRS